jgi:hypothetical protein
MNQVTNKIQDIPKECDLKLIADQVNFIYSNTGINSVLRQFCVANILYRTSEKAIVEDTEWEKGAHELQEIAGTGRKISLR